MPRLDAVNIFDHASALATHDKYSYHRTRPNWGRGNIGHNTETHLQWTKAGGDVPTVAIYLYRTPVVTYHPNGTVTLANGGWPTITTHDRITRYTPDGWNAHSHKHTTYIRTPAGRYSVPADGLTLDVRTGAPVS